MKMMSLIHSHSRARLLSLSVSTTNLFMFKSWLVESVVARGYQKTIFAECLLAFKISVLSTRMCIVENSQHTRIHTRTHTVAEHTEQAFSLYANEEP